MSFERSCGLRIISCMCSVVTRHVLACASAIVLLSSSDICAGSEKLWLSSNENLSHCNSHLYHNLRVILNRKTPILNIFTNIFILSAEMCYIINSYTNSSRSVAFFTFIRTFVAAIPHPKTGLWRVITEKWVKPYSINFLWEKYGLSLHRC